MERIRVNGKVKNKAVRLVTDARGLVTDARDLAQTTVSEGKHFLGRHQKDILTAVGIFSAGFLTALLFRRR